MKDRDENSLNVSGEDAGSLSMQELFRIETENQTTILTSGLLELERAQTDVRSRETAVEGSESQTRDVAPNTADCLEALMRAAHSLKGAARIVNLPPAVSVAHAMEDCFVAAQRGRIELRQPHIDVLLRGVDLLASIGKFSDPTLATAAGVETQNAKVEEFLVSLTRLLPRKKLLPASAAKGPERTVEPPVRESRAGDPALSTTDPSDAVALKQTRPIRRGESSPVSDPTKNWASNDRVLRLTAENLNRLLGLAGESLVESRWLRPFSESMLRLKRMQSDMEQMLDALRQSLEGWENNAETLKAAEIWSPESGDPIADSRLTTQDSRLSVQQRVNELFRKAAETRQFLGDRLQELDLFDRRSANLSNRLYLEVLRTRMRPFGDGTRRFPRMVRDLARSLGKQARLEIIGENTQVDRDILDRLETPLAHLLRNAVDHGCETTQARARAGKPPEARIVLEARHSAGMLLVTVSDDGLGADIGAIRERLKANAEKLKTEKLKSGSAFQDFSISAFYDKLTEAELLQFLFLPGFSMKDTVTELSGRGVGLDIVQNMVKSVRGSVRVYQNKKLEDKRSSLEAGESARLISHSNAPPTGSYGLTFEMQLPLTMSVLRTLLVEVGGEPYAFPLAQIAQTLRLPRERIETLESRQHFTLGEQQVGLLAAHRVFETSPSSESETGAGLEYGSGSLSPDARLRIPDSKPRNPDSGLPVVVLGDRSTRYGLVVDRFLGERELVVQALDARLGKVKDISAAALMEDGSPVLIVDVDDLMRSIEKMVQESAALSLEPGVQTQNPSLQIPVSTVKKKRVLAVDDSLTVRELERKLLTGRGFLADVATDGMDAWQMLKETVRSAEPGVTNPGFQREPSGTRLQTPDLRTYDLVITDVDMPRMDGIELATLIKRDPQLKSLPVMIVSYKDREEDRLRGLEAGADYYLTKGSFQDETFMQAVMDLIGEAEENQQ